METHISITKIEMLMILKKITNKDRAKLTNTFCVKSS
jgi:hypothetical protein